MTIKPIHVNQGNIGRMAVVVYAGQCFVGNVLDQVAGTTTPKRVRIQFDPVHQGEVLQPWQYEFKEWADED